MENYTLLSHILNIVLIIIIILSHEAKYDNMCQEYYSCSQYYYNRNQHIFELFIRVICRALRSY